MHDDACFVQRMLNRLFRIEDFADFLEGTAPCFDKEEVDDDEFKYVPEDE